MCRCQRNSELSWREPSVKECVVYGLTIWQKHNSQEAILHLRYLHPAPDTAISLDSFPNRRPDGLLDPFVSDNSPIRPVTDCLEVACNLHAVNVSDFRFAGSSCRITIALGGERTERGARCPHFRPLERIVMRQIRHDSSIPYCQGASTPPLRDCCSP